nr:zinc-binding dehydrogenase [Klebsiella pneumoniae subsp. pneumoniae]
MEQPSTVAVCITGRDCAWHRWSLTVCGAVRQNHGARVIALTSNDVKAQLLSALGADHVINYRHYPEWSVKVRELTQGRG